jgi:DNA polymerase III epsilon subunit-like protein
MNFGLKKLNIIFLLKNIVLSRLIYIAMSASAKTPIFTHKNYHSVTYPADKAEAYQKERYTLTFDFETNRLPDESVVWDEFKISEKLDTYRDSGKPVIDRKTGKQKVLPKSDASKWPHSVQFCYILYDNQLHTAKVVNEVIRLPEGETMDPGSEAVHKISLAKTQGRTKRIVNPKTGEEMMTFNPEIHEVLIEFMKDFEKADVIVAHNLHFDRNMLLAEMDRLRRRQGFEVFEEYIQNLYANKKEFCTGKFGADVCQISAVNKMGKEYYKMPKLNALYTHLFGYAPDESKLHDALMDVVICMRCFYKIRYDVDLCEQDLDPTIAGYIEIMSPEGYKCGKGPSSLKKKALSAIAEEEEEVAEDVAEEIEQQKDAEQYYEELRESAAAASPRPSAVSPRRSSRLSATPAVDYAKGLAKRKYTKKRHHKGKQHKKSKGAPKKRKHTKRKN